MNIEELKSAVSAFYDRTITKQVNGETMYATEYKVGLSKQLKLGPLGYFESELKALQALYDYLKANNRI